MNVKYKVAFAETVVEHIRFLTAAAQAGFGRYRTSASLRAFVGDTEPEASSAQPLAPWELRVGSLRVIYEVANEEPDTVRFLAIGKKWRHSLRIGGQEIEL